MRVFEYVNAVAGWNLSPEEMMAVGGRIQTLKLLFNLREGIERNHSINSRLLGFPPLKSGSARGRQVLLDEMIKAYWQESGWDEQTGLPAKRVLEDLGEVFTQEELLIREKFRE